MFYFPPQKAQKPSKKKVSKTLLLEPPYLGQMGTGIDSNVYVPTYECSAIQRYQNSTLFAQGKKVFFVQTNRQTENVNCLLFTVYIRGLGFLAWLPLRDSAFFLWG